MKVALIDPSLFTIPYDVKLAEGLQRQGLAVALYGRPLAPGEALDSVGLLRPHFYRPLAHPAAARLPGGVTRIAKGALHFRDMQRLVAVLAAERPAIIHLQWLPLPMIDSRFLTPLAAIAPLILTVHDSRPFNANPGSRLQGLGATAIFRRFDHLITHTEQGRARLIAAGVAPGRIHRIPHGFLHEDAAVPPPPVRAAAAPLRVLLFGKLKPYKGLDVLIAAAAGLTAQQRAQVRFYIAGKPYMDMAPLRTAVAAAGLDGNFDWDLRFIPDAEMAGIFAAADILAFPYREIEMSGVLMTALRLNRPMIASAIGGFAEMLQDGGEALLVPPDDAPALTLALARMIDDARLRAALADGLNRMAAGIPGWDEIARRTAALYAEAAGQRGPAAETAA